MQNYKKLPKVVLLSAAMSLVGVSLQTQADQYLDAAKKWVNDEFTESTLSKSEQLKEMEWFRDAAKSFRGMEINVASETIATHEYEAKVLAKAFTEITGIKINHD
ncbi:MAG: carbohydrate ABC transporter substrate-binding protein, partial [Exilibacterium sp.]